jgi:hypothetical protein
LAHPIVEQLQIVEQAKDYLDKGASYNKTCAWVETKCGRKISPPALKRAYEDDPAREAGRAERNKLIANYRENNFVRKGVKGRTLEENLVRKAGRVKASLSKYEKRLKKLRETIPQEIQDIKLEKKEAVKPPMIPAMPLPDVKKYIKPNPGPQTDFLAAPEFEVLFGGQAGGGKSHAIIIDPLRTAHLKSHRALTFRRTNDELRDLIWMSKEIYPNVIPGSKFNDQKSTWTFPAGGTHWFTYLDRDDDVLRYQGQPFTNAYWDELTQWPSPYPFDYIRSRIRTTDPEMQPYIGQRCTTNPGGPGHGWVKRMFIDPAPPNTPFIATDLQSGKPLLYPEGHEKAGQPLFYRKFIPSQLKDNPYLSEGGAYERTLMSLPEIQRKQLLEGNWDVAEGAAFSEFDRSIHVCQPFEIPDNWTKFRACDWGYESHACCLWFAEDNDKKLWVYRELYTQRVRPEDFARRIAELEYGERILYGVLDSSCWGGRQDGGPPIVNMMNLAIPLNWRMADRSRGSRIARKQELHARLKVNGEAPNRTTGLTIVSSCINLIRTLPVLPLDKNDSEDVDTKSEDHAYDALAYGCATRPYGRAKRYHQPIFPVATPVSHAADSVFGY